MFEGASLDDLLTMFKEIINDLETLDVKYNERTYVHCHYHRRLLEIIFSIFGILSL